MNVLQEYDVEDIVDWETVEGLVDELIYIRDNYIHSSDDSIDIRLIETSEGEFSIAFGDVSYDLVHYSNCVSGEIFESDTREQCLETLLSMFQELDF